MHVESRDFAIPLSDTLVLAVLSTASQRNLRMTQQDNVATGFILVTAAGLATALGAGLVYSPWFVKIANKKFLAGSLGLAAGVMMFVSFIEIFFKSNDAFVEHGFKENVAFSLATALFFAGIVFIQLLDLVVHSISDYEKDLHEVCDVVLEKGFEKNVPGNANKTTSPTRPSTAIEEIKREVKDRESQMQGSIADVAPRASTGTTFELTKRGSDVENMSTSESTLDKDPHRVRLNRMGLMTALAIGIHNFPEGLATFLGTLDDPSVGAALALAIGIHNIPEGLCVAIPIFYSTGSRHKSFLWALLSGVSEPIGAAIGYAVVVASGGEVSPLAFGILFGLVAGMMVQISIKELLPTAFRYDAQDKVVTYAVIVGMVVMALSLVLFALAVSSDDDDE